MKFFKFIILAFCLFFSFPLIAQENLDDVIDELVNKLDDAHDSSRKMRLAIMPLTQAGAATANQQTFGAYFAETLISRLSEKSEKFRLFERSRLDALMQEAALGQSGLMDSEAAIRLGELAPIDVVFSGTYTLLNKEIAINSRLIDVVSGEILLSFSSKLMLTSQLEGLFFRPQEKAENAEEICRQKQEQLRSLFNDLSSEDKVDQMVQFAITFPFDMQCGKIHFEVISQLKRYKLQNERYHDFLIHTLDAIRFPQEDDRALAIIGFLGSDGEIDEVEWKSGYTAAKKVGNYTLSTYLRNLLLPDKDNIDEDLVIKRSSFFLEDVKDRKVGLPVAIKFHKAYFALMRAFSYIYARENRFMFDLYRKYKGSLNIDGKDGREVLSLLKNMYWREKDSEKRNQILEWLSDFFNETMMDDDMGFELFAFAKSLQTNGKGNFTKENVYPAPKKHFDFLLKKNSSNFCQGLQAADVRSQIEERQDFCLQYGLECEALPAVETLLEQLNSSDNFERDRAAEMLALMGSSAQKAEKTMINILATFRVNKGQYSRKMREEAIKFLGNLPTKDPQGISALADQLSSLEYKLPDYAADALVAVGKPAVDTMIEKLSDPAGSVQYRAAVILGRLGKDAAKAIPDLEKLAQTTRMHDIKNAAQQSLLLIKGQ